MDAKTIVDQTNASFQIYLGSLDQYSDGQFSYKENSETWSLAQMYEHLCMSSKKFFLANTKRCLEKRNGEEGGEKNKSGEGVFKYGGFPKMKFKMPEAMAAIELVGKSREEYKTEINEILDSAEKFIDFVDADSGTYKTFHPVLGMLNAKEWFQNLEMHTRHHLHQKAELEALVANV